MLNLNFLIPLLVAVAGPSGMEKTEDVTQDSVSNFALLVGSNEGGGGQTPLAYAGNDVLLVRDVLTSLGNYPLGQTSTLVDPTKSTLNRALEELREKLDVAASLGQQSRLFFFYSGHAKSNALNLGKEELPLAELRARLIALPATLKVVVLDACQSGAFSGIKGAEPSADFSFNSVAQLNTSGVAVLASSSEAELSQESSELGASHFTHHFVVALRGAGDNNVDGRVTLDEAYQYAYNNTLRSTAKTAVGRQHATLETELSGKGDVPLTFLHKAQSYLELPGKMGGTALIQSLPSNTVVAEINNIQGRGIRLAVPMGSYQAVIRQEGLIFDCRVDTQTGNTTVLDINHCDEVKPVDTLSKGGFSGPRWSVELGLGITEVEPDAFNQRLKEFGYICRPSASNHWKFSAAGFWRWNRNIQWGINFENMESQSVLRKSTHDKPGKTDRWWSSSGTGEQQEYTWSSYAVVGNLRAGLPLFRELFVPYVQLGVGVGVALSEFIETISPENNTGKEADVGYYLSGGAGLLWKPWQRFGFTTEMKYAYSPVMRTLMGDTHSPTGLSFASGLLATF